MSINFFDCHRAMLDRARQAIAERGYWSPFCETPSASAYGETAAANGKAAFEAHLNRVFELDQAGTIGLLGNEISPYGPALGIRYPKVDIDQLIRGMNTAGLKWKKAGPQIWTGVALEIVKRLNERCFEMAHAVMHTTGQPFMMAFQAGGPHAQDRAVEAIAYAWEETRRVPAQALWEKPQGKHDPLRMQKSYRITPRGIGLVIGCCTFPTWNSYPGLFANLATGNTAIVKPHPHAILPLAITVQIARTVIAEAGYDPNVVTLVAHEAGDDLAAELSLRPEVKLIDFTGSAANGNWLESNATQAQVFTEKSGVNQIIIDSTDDFKGMVNNIAVSLALYSGQMCTTPQNIFIPREGIESAEGHVSFDDVVAAIVKAVAKVTSDPAKAVELLGAIQNDAIINRMAAAREIGQVLLDSKALEHPQFPAAKVLTPLLVKAPDNKPVTEEFFGPISFVIATADTAESIALARKSVQEQGALSLSAYTCRADVKEALCEAAADACVALSLNMTGSVLVNQSAAFSDYHGTGANPAANAALTDSAFVSGRFRVAQTREPA
ncbi:phenylacetic acid degradation protein PaaN [Advenella kashmirensis]